MLDIESLRLTEKDRESLPTREYYNYGMKWEYAAIAEAQFAKTLHGILEWLRWFEEYGGKEDMMKALAIGRGHAAREAANDLEAMLKAAGIMESSKAASQAQS